MYNGLPEAANITLTIITIIALVWVALLLFDLFFVFFFNTILKKHSKAMIVILNTKYENTKKLYEIIQSYQVPIDDKILQELNRINTSAFSKPDSKEGEEVRNILSYLKDEAMFIANKNKDLLNKADFQIARNNVLELDTQYRNDIAMYNADVLGYNYWISFLPCRFIFLIFKVQKKNIIS